MINLTEQPVRLLAGTRRPEAERALQSEFGIPPLVAAVLVRRGYEDLPRAEKFLNPSLDDLHNPSLLPDYEAARNEILGAKERGETIFVHGDYDVDGVTSASLFTRFLKNLGCTVVTHVPHRMREGYGIHENAVDAAISSGAKLFLTCDCGVGAHTQVERARSAGMAVVVTDHHLPSETLPRAQAIVNPHRVDATYPFRELSGVGVVFRLCEGISRDLDISLSAYRRAFIDLAAIGTVADVMPLVDENRIITRFGVEQIPKSKKVGLQALLREAGLTEKSHLTSRDIGFMIGPRLNAAGRIDDAALSLDLLLQTDEIQASLLARQIEAINSQRKLEQGEIEQAAVELVLEQELDQRTVIVIGNDSWHPGLIGLVAGRLVERFRRPSIVMAIDQAKGMIKASARSIPGFHLGDSMNALSHLLSGGGHAMAAGFSAPAENAAQIAIAFHEYGLTVLSDEDFKPTFEVDVEVLPSEVTFAAVDAMNRLEPFGAGNSEPTFLARKVRIDTITPTQTGEHANLNLSGEGLRSTRGIAFRQAERFLSFGVGALIDVVFKPVIEEWNGSRYLKWRIEHAELSAT